MPHIIVMADNQTEPGDGAVMLRERISSSDLESRHFGSQLLERLHWAVGDAHVAEESRSPTGGEDDHTSAGEWTTSPAITSRGSASADLPTAEVVPAGARQAEARQAEARPTGAVTTAR